MNKKRFAILTLAVIVVQSGILSAINIFSATANLFIVFIICLAMLYGRDWAAYTGLGLGLMEDVMFSNVLGVHALIYFLIGYVSGKLLKNGGGRILTGAVFVFAASIIAKIGVILIAMLIDPKLAQVSYLKGPAIFEGFLNMGLYFIFVFIMKKFIPPYPIRKFTGI